MDNSKIRAKLDWKYDGSIGNHTAWFINCIYDIRQSPNGKWRAICLFRGGNTYRDLKEHWDSLDEAKATCQANADNLIKLYSR